LLYKAWKRIGSLTGLKCNDNLDEEDPSNERDFNNQWINNEKNQSIIINDYLIEYYLNNSIQLLSNSNLPTNSKLNNESVNIF
jgi:hypothetical protein